MAGVMIGVDPHKASHTAVAISGAEEPLGELRVRASGAQAERLLEWAAAWPDRTWAVEGAGGLGHLLTQQLLSAGERVLDVQPKLGARVRLLNSGNVNKNDPNDARSVAVAALRSPGVREARPDDHAAVLKVWSKRLLGRSCQCRHRPGMGLPRLRVLPHPGQPAQRRHRRGSCMGVEPLTHPDGRTTEPLRMTSPGADSPSAATPDTQPDWSDCQTTRANANAHNW